VLAQGRMVMVPQQTRDLLAVLGAFQIHSA
jgi:hypothetical protein